MNRALHKDHQPINVVYTKIDLKNLVDSMGAYHNKPIETEGLYRCGWERSDLMREMVEIQPMLQAGQHYYDPRTIWIDRVYSKSMFSCDSLNKHIIVVRGILDTSGHGHLGNYNATIKDAVVRLR